VTHEESGGLEMARTVKAFLVTICLLFAVEARAISGNEWRQLSQTAQVYYVIGVFDGSSEFKDTILQTQEQTPVITGFEKVANCAAGMQVGQVLAIIQRYVETNPAEWHRRVSIGIDGA
jgi:hypothetical protein